MLRAEVLDWLHRRLRPRLYIEIGVRWGNSLSIVLPGTRAVGIDPEPRIRHRRPLGTRLYSETSDDFFTHPGRLPEPIDLALIDGLHLFEFALRDFRNIEKHASHRTVVVLDDPYPKSEEQAGRTLLTEGFWAGDVWRTVGALRRHRPDLAVTVLDTPPTGLAVITGLDPASTVLTDGWERIHDEMLAVPYAPETVEELLRPQGPSIQLLEELIPPGPRATMPLPAALAGRALRPPHREVVAWNVRRLRRAIRR